MGPAVQRRTSVAGQWLANGSASICVYTITSDQTALQVEPHPLRSRAGTTTWRRFRRGRPRSPRRTCCTSSTTSPAAGAARSARAASP